MAATLLWGEIGGADGLYQFWQATEDGGAAEPEFVVDGGVTADDGVGGDVVGDSGLGGRDNAIADFAVPGDADLPGEDNVLSNVGGPGEAGLRAQQGVFADAGAVADLDQIVNLRAAGDAGFSDTGAIDAGICLNFHFVFKDCRAGLDDLVPAAGIVSGKTEAVSSDDCTVLQNYVVAEAAMFANDGVGVGEEVVSDDGAGVDDGVCQERRVGSDAGVAIDDNVRADVGVGSDLRGGVDYGSGMDSVFVAGWLIEELKSAGEGEVGVLRAEHGSGNGGEVFGDDDGGGASRAGGGGIFRVSDEGYLTGLSFFDASDSADFCIGEAVFEASLKGFGELCKFHRHCSVRGWQAAIVMQGEWRGVWARTARARSPSQQPVGAGAPKNLFVEHGDLELIFGAAATAVGSADDREDGKRVERAARDEDALGVGTEVGRIDQEAFGDLLGEVVGHEAFDDFVVLELDADPEAFCARAAGEGLAREGFGVAELADEVDALDFLEVDADDVAGGVEQFELAFVDKAGGGDVAGDGVAIQLADDDLLVGRGHGGAEAKRLRANNSEDDSRIFLKRKAECGLIVAKILTLCYFL